MIASQNIFNINQCKIHRDRAATKPQHGIYKYVSADLNERLLLCKLPSQVKMLEFGGRDNGISSSIHLELMIHADISTKMLQRFENKKVVQCNENSLPFDQRVFDVVVSNLHMHWSNDIPLVLQDFHRVLKDQGVFLVSMFGGKSLKDLRDVFLEVEIKDNDIKYHVSPMVKLDSLSLLMQKVGFRDVIVDSYALSLEFSNFEVMLKGLRDMGESNCLAQKVSYLRRDTLQKVKELYSKKCAKNRALCLEVEVLNAIGYK
ncbi:MAG: methyltransferase domain-containing protein [Rickettsiales bacterium]|nr:methyltransferase domain-containing protein [Rickettsiales bacterium]